MERIICSESHEVSGFKLVAAGTVTLDTIAGLECYIKRQRARLIAQRVVKKLGPWRLWLQNDV